MHHGMCIRFGRRVGILCASLTIGEIFAGFVIYDVVGRIDSGGCIGADRRTGNGDAAIVKDDLRHSFR